MDSSVYRPISERVLADDWGRLTKYEYELRLRDGSWQRQTREAYDRGNGATCLLYNPANDHVLLTRQFRLPVLLNGGLKSLIETPAGLLEGAEPATRMRAELIEETGYEVSELTHLFDIYMSPGSVTEYLAFFHGEYAEKHKVGAGGGSAAEGEDIDVLEIALPEAMRMIDRGEIRDAKTIILLQHLALRLLQEKHGLR
ncbi:NUDIX domain-containing protein [Agrobacterium genomosp. 13]|uniref:GDP-mannose pyrophosphatase n=1 Tax=Agrobacterium genomosp. 13 str. CFBP 6927 TaxID=1183428 RepID=A0ABP2BQ94_9HYPH|nr:NUDIX domain-containing protein [Agrobacterium genomosp. 13]CUX66281.1 putative Nucleoside diphosphate hydrolase [Agrobacterium genomosp. 13 str. CFBP 6927]